MLPWEAGSRFFALTEKPSFDSFIPQRFGGRGYPPPADEKRQDNVSFVSWSCFKKSVKDCFVGRWGLFLPQKVKTALKTRLLSRGMRRSIGRRNSRRR